MKTVGHITSIFIALILITVSSLFAQDTGTEHTLNDSSGLAFTNVTVIDVEEGIAKPAMSVIINGDRIIAVGSVDEINIPAETDIIDASGKYLIPGLWDMHVHFSSDQISRETVLPLFIANGVTGVRGLSGGCFGSCSGPLSKPVSTVHKWREDIATGNLIGPRIIAAGPIIYGPGPGEPSSIESPATEEHGRALARRHSEYGVDMIKVYDQIPADAFRGLVDEGKELGLPVVGHVPWEIGAVAAVQAGMRSIEHLYGVIDECSATVSEQRPALIEAYKAGDDLKVWLNLFQSMENFSVAQCNSIYPELVKHDVWQVPTLVAGGRTASGVEWRNHTGMNYLARPELEYWVTTLAENAVSIPGGLASLPLLQYRIVLISMDMYRAGVPLLAGSDALSPGVFPGFGLHDELELLVQAGLTPAEALRAATLEPARYLESVVSQGTVDKEKVADLVLLDANPLENITNTQKIRAVVANGRYFDRRTLDKILKEAEKAAKG
jgi:imidazolonepropionase-like amidohydrolase